MNKNTVIALLLIAIIIGFVLFFSKKPREIVVNNTSVGSTTENLTNTNTQTPPAASKPDVPTVETSAANGSSSSTASVTGKIRPNGATTSYWYEYGETTALGARTSIQVLGGGYTLITAPGYLTGLKANTLYYYRLSAKNSFGTVNGATFTLMTNYTPAPQGSIPTVRTESASNITRASAGVAGTVNPNGASTAYWFEYGNSSDFGLTTALLAINGMTGQVPVSIEIGGLNPLTKYYYRLNAQNQYGTVIGGTANFTTTGPANSSAPTADTTSASGINQTSVQFNGRLNAGGIETSYWFEYSSDSLLGSLIGSGTPHRTMSASAGTKTVKETQNGLARNTTYYYRLVVQNAQGTVLGDIVSFKTK